MIKADVAELQVDVAALRVLVTQLLAEYLSEMPDARGELLKFRQLLMTQLDPQMAPDRSTAKAAAEVGRAVSRILDTIEGALSRQSH